METDSSHLMGVTEESHLRRLLWLSSLEQGKKKHFLQKKKRLMRVFPHFEMVTLFHIQFEIYP